MPRSLEEIQIKFEKNKNIKTKRFPTNEETKDNISSQDNRLKRMAVAADIIFAVSLVLMGVCAIILSQGETGVRRGAIYDLVNSKREIIMVLFAVSIILSFVLRFFAQKKGNKDE